MWRELTRRVRDGLELGRIGLRVARDNDILGHLRPAGVVAALTRLSKPSLASVVRFHAANDPHRTALVFGERRWSYFELDRTIERLAGQLASHGVGPGHGVLWMMPNDPAVLAVVGATGRLGASTIAASWRSTPDELRHLLRDSGARALFFASAQADVVRAALDDDLARALGDRRWSVGPEVDGFGRYEDLLAAEAVPAPDRGDGPVVIYTSGTTGKPKGAVRSFSGGAALPVLGFFDRIPFRWGQRHLTVCPLYHSTGFGFTLMSLGLGSTVVLLEHFEPRVWLETMQRHRVQHCAMVPTMLHRALEVLGDDLSAAALPDLVAIVSGGAPLSGALAGRVLDALGPILYNFYGATETGLVTLADPTDLRLAPGTIGRVVAGNEVRILDDEGHPVPPGEVGELYVRSTNLVVGYHRNDAATRDSMRDGFFSVGDLARVDARGYVFLEGRKRDMVISGGVNVYPREVEDVLAMHPAVGEVAVVGLPDEQWGERVHAVVAVRAGASLETDELLAFARDRLAGPKRPRGVTFVEALPRNPTGKVLKRELVAELAVGADSP